MLTTPAKSTLPSFALIFVSLVLLGVVCLFLALWFTANPDYISQMAACQTNTRVSLADCLSFNTEVSAYRLKLLLSAAP